MNKLSYEGMFLRGFVRNLCFIAFGFTVFYDPFDKFNIFNLVLGILFCLIVGWLFKKFLRGILSFINKDLKKVFGKAAIFMAVDNAMLFFVPFSVMMIAASYILNWTTSGAFLSSGIMVVGTTAAIEVGKLMEKPKLKNTVAASIISFAFAFLITTSIPLVTKVPDIVEGVVYMIPNLLKGGGGP